MAVTTPSMTQSGKRSRNVGSVAAVAAAASLRDSLTFKFHEVDDWLRDNDYLLARYRKTSNSYLLSLQSLFYLHNQTGNIYTHLIPAIIFTAYAFDICPKLSTRYPTADFYDILAFGIFIGSAVICFAFSASYHIFGNHSYHVHRTWLMMDLYGIFFLIVGTVYSGTYYGFYCEPKYWIGYSVGIFAIVSISATAVASPRFQKPEWRWARASLFVAIGWSGAFPMRHAVTAFGIEQAHKQMGWWYFIIEGLSYITGALIYAMRIPERFRPGFFDIFGSSHQIFHLAAVSGAAWHMVGLLNAFDYNHDPVTRRC